MSIYRRANRRHRQRAGFVRPHRERIRGILSSRNLTVADLARATGMSYWTLYPQLFRNRFCQISTLNRVAASLDIDAREISHQDDEQLGAPCRPVARAVSTKPKPKRATTVRKFDPMIPERS